MLYKAEAVVIRNLDYGEGNIIMTLFTRTMGKMSVMARGAKKMNSRHFAVSQLFTYGQFSYYKSGQMGTLQHAEIIESYYSLRNDLLKTAYAAYVVEMLDRMLVEQEGSEYLFAQLLALFDAIESGKDPQVLSHLFEMKMLQFAGYMPELDRCVACGRESDLPIISGEMGGLICASCRHQVRPIVQVSERTLKMLRLFRRLDIERIGKIDLSAESRDELKRCMRNFFDAHVSGYWKSRSFLDQMEKYDL